MTYLASKQEREEDYPVCQGCSEANGTDGWAVVRHAPPPCRTFAEMERESTSEPRTPCK